MPVRSMPGLMTISSSLSPRISTGPPNVSAIWLASPIRSSTAASRRKPPIRRGTEAIVLPLIVRSEDEEVGTDSEVMRLGMILLLRRKAGSAHPKSSSKERAYPYRTRWTAVAHGQPAIRSHSPSCLHLVVNGRLEQLLYKTK